MGDVENFKRTRGRFGEVRVRDERTVRPSATHQVHLSGYPLSIELRYPKENFPVLSFTLAGEVEVGGAMHPYYIPVRILGSWGERVADQLHEHKGAVLVQGELDQYRPEGGTTRTALKAHLLRFIPPSEGNYSTDARGQPRELLALNRFSGFGVAASVVTEAQVGEGNLNLKKFRASFRASGKGRNVYLTVEAWGTVADLLHPIAEGDLFFVEGHLKRRLAQSEKDGRYWEYLAVAAHLVKPLLKASQFHPSSSNRGEVFENPDLDLEEDLPF